MPASPRTWTVGALAKQTGLTVRALHHYEEIGLLAPSSRGANNYRLYSESDVARLQQIVALKQLGFTLERIADALRHKDMSPLTVIRLQIAHVQAALKDQQALLEKLGGFARILESKEKVSVEDLLAAIELSAAIEGHYSPEEHAVLRKRAEGIGEKKMRDVEAEWPRLMAEAKRHMDAGTDPGAPAMRKVAKRWKELVDLFTGGDPAMAAKVRKLYEDHPKATSHFGPDPAMMAYVQKAMEAAGIRI